MTTTRAAALTLALVTCHLPSAAGQDRAAPESPKPVQPIAAGTAAPPFALEDQFGRRQSNETLKGRNGTVLLFFRSADW